jgi:hypothetical protein
MNRRAHRRRYTFFPYIYIPRAPPIARSSMNNRMPPEQLLTGNISVSD